MSEPAWPAPAKLNLFLHVLSRRPDGYHNLQTCFQFIDLCDEIDIQVRDDGEIRRSSGPAEVSEEMDLCIRAARALQSAANCRQGADLTVTKRIPMGAGLGGGSSDAATCLVALNHLWGLGWPVEKLARLGLNLGADVPVFVYGRTAWAEGVGEQLTPLYPPLAPLESNYLILKPKVSVSTAEVFQDPELTRNSAPITIHGFLASGGRNDCTPVVCRRYAEVAGALRWLSRFGSARLTGTGACVFIACESLERARAIAEDVPTEFDVIVTRGFNDSPLAKRLAAGLAGVR